MTFSIVARCDRTSQLGVAAVTGTPGVGQLLTWAQARVGAIATQGWINPYIGIDGLDMLANGHPAAKALQAVMGLDDDRELRQAAFVDARGDTAAFTGSDCEDVAEQLPLDGFSVQGNLLENADTVEACAKAFRDSSEDVALVERLMAALEAGQAAGGDRRGARSATVYVVATELYPLWDLRVDDHDQPLENLRQLHRVFSETLLPQILRLPTRRNSRGGLSREDRGGVA